LGVKLASRRVGPRSRAALAAAECHPDLLDRAGTLGRVLFTRDDDLLTEATRRQRAGIPFGGVIYAHQQAVSIGQAVHDLEYIALAGVSADVENQVLYLPL
jgi:hypothetical protein